MQPEDTPMEMDSQDDMGQQDQEILEPVMETPPHFFFIAAVRVAYQRDGKLKERSVNILLDLIVPHITQQTLTDINRAAANRIVEDMKVEFDSIQDIVIQGISSLGMMTPDEFRAPTENITEREETSEVPQEEAAEA